VIVDHLVREPEEAAAQAKQLRAQHVVVEVLGQRVHHGAAVTTGSGTADFYRDGRAWHGRWSKPTDTSTTRSTVNGAPMLLAPGETYVVLVRGRGPRPPTLPVR
jgi:Protein of unknown function (DUF3048) C-terminal domain